MGYLIGSLVLKAKLRPNVEYTFAFAATEKQPTDHRHKTNDDGMQRFLTDFGHFFFLVLALAVVILCSTGKHAPINGTKLANIYDNMFELNFVN